MEKAGKRFGASAPQNLRAARIIGTIGEVGTVWRQGRIVPHEFHRGFNIRLAE
jgi:hypothetical protein